MYVNIIHPSKIPNSEIKKYFSYYDGK